MKKTSRRLSLSTETIRNLDTDALSGAMGAAAVQIEAARRSRRWWKCAKKCTAYC